jgi:hypothetical protein
MLAKRLLPSVRASPGPGPARCKAAVHDGRASRVLNLWPRLTRRLVYLYRRRFRSKYARRLYSVDHCQLFASQEPLLSVFPQPPSHGPPSSPARPRRDTHQHADHGRQAPLRPPPRLARRRITRSPRQARRLHRARRVGVLQPQRRRPPTRHASPPLPSHSNGLQPAPRSRPPPRASPSRTSPSAAARKTTRAPTPPRPASPCRSARSRRSSTRPASRPSRRRC